MQSITLWVSRLNNIHTQLLDPACKCLFSLCKQMYRKKENGEMFSFYMLFFVSFTASATGRLIRQKYYIKLYYI